MVVPIPQDSIEVSLLKMIGSSGIPWVINLITNINNHSNIKIWGRWVSKVKFLKIDLVVNKDPNIKLKSIQSSMLKNTQINYWTTIIWKVYIAKLVTGGKWVTSLSLICICNNELLTTLSNSIAQFWAKSSAEAVPESIKWKRTEPKPHRCSTSRKARHHPKELWARCM